MMVAPVGGETIDRIVAVVNDSPITKSELDVLLIPIYKQYKTVYAGGELNKKMEDARNNLLEQLIDEKLIAQEAMRLEIMVKESEIDDRVNEIMSRFENGAEFDTFLGETGMSLVRLRDRYKEQIAAQKLQAYEVRQKVVISPLDIQNYYDAHVDEFSEREKVKARTILIKTAEDTEEARREARTTLESLVARILTGEKFEDIAKQYSRGQNSELGGDLGFVRRGAMIKQFDDVLFHLKIGELSEILETPLGCHVFTVEARQESSVKALSLVEEEISEVLYREESRRRYTEWVDGLKEHAYISIK